jgi:hypothetical protein
MGRDIHVHLERQQPDSGEWVNLSPCRNEDGFAVECWFTERNYDLFSVLFSDEHVMSMPRGLPADVTSVTRRSFEEFASNHSATWYSWGELWAIVPTVPSERFVDFLLRVREMNTDDQPLRLVMWLDN